MKTILRALVLASSWSDIDLNLSESCVNVPHRETFHQINAVTMCSLCLCGKFLGLQSYKCFSQAAVNI